MNQRAEMAKPGRKSANTRQNAYRNVNQSSSADFDLFASSSSLCEDQTLFSCSASLLASLPDLLLRATSSRLMQLCQRQLSMPSFNRLASNRPGRRAPTCDLPILARARARRFWAGNRANSNLSGCSRLAAVLQPSQAISGQSGQCFRQCHLCCLRWASFARPSHRVSAVNGFRT